MKHDFLDTSMRQILDAQERTQRLAGGSSTALAAMQDILNANDRLLGRGIAAQIALDVDAGLRRHLSHFEKHRLDDIDRLTASAVGPLMRLRAETIYETELDRIASEHRRAFGPSISDVLATHEKSVGAAMRELAGMTNSIAGQVARAFEDSTRAQLEAFANPFASINERMRRELTGMKGVSDLFDPGQWARSLGLPMLDAASIATVARSWGAEGAFRNLRELGGLDSQTLRLIAEALEVEEEHDDQPSSEGRQRGGITLDTLLAILSIILSIAMYQWQQEDSAASEARARSEHQAISVEIKAADDRSAQRLEQLARAFENAIAQIHPAAVEQPRFVVRSRGALIRKGKGGSAVAAEAVPGQVVTLIAQEGKWIEISYFDFATGKQRAGWALKKYFVRVRSGAIEQLGAGD